VKMTLDQLRASVGDSETEQRMLDAINAAAARCGDNLYQIAAVLFGAYVAIAAATGQGEAMMRIAEANAVTARLDMTRGVPS